METTEIGDTIRIWKQAIVRMEFREDVSEPNRQRFDVIPVTRPLFVQIDFYSCRRFDSRLVWRRVEP